MNANKRRYLNSGFTSAFTCVHQRLLISPDVVVRRAAVENVPLRNRRLAPSRLILSAVQFFISRGGASLRFSKGKFSTAARLRGLLARERLPTYVGLVLCRFLKAIKRIMHLLAAPS